MDDRKGDETFGLYDAKARFSELVERAAAGDEITITKHGVPQARLVPMPGKKSREEIGKAIERWRKARKGLSLRGLKIRDLIAEGRR